MNSTIQEDSESMESSSATSTDDAHSSSSIPSTSYLQNQHNDNFTRPPSRSPSDTEHTDNSSLESFSNHSSGAESNPPTTPRTYGSSFTHRPTEQEKALIKCAHISNEHVRLSNLLQDLPPKRLASILEKKLHKRDSKTVVAMSILFPRTEFPAGEKFHCARCHQIFTDREEGNDCVMRHPNKAVVKVREDSSGATFHCHSCRKSFKLENMYFYNENVNAYLAGFCFSGKHTSNPQYVAYGGAVKTCEEQGCVEFYV